MDSAPLDGTHGSFQSLEGIKRQLFLVTYGERNHMLVWAMGREDAKRQCRHWFGGNADNYTVNPLTNPGDTIHVALTLSI